MSKRNFEMKDEPNGLDHLEAALDRIPEDPASEATAGWNVDWDDPADWDGGDEAWCLCTDMGTDIIF